MKYKVCQLLYRYRPNELWKIAEILDRPEIARWTRAARLCMIE